VVLHSHVLSNSDLEHFGHNILGAKCLDFFPWDRSVHWTLRCWSWLRSVWTLRT